MMQKRIITCLSTFLLDLSASSIGSFYKSAVYVKLIINKRINFMYRLTHGFRGGMGYTRGMKVHVASSC